MYYEFYWRRETKEVILIHLIAVWRKGKCIIISNDTIQKGDLLKKPIHMDEIIGITTEKITKGDIVKIESGLISRAAKN